MSHSPEGMSGERPLRVIRSGEFEQAKERLPAPLPDAEVDSIVYEAEIVTDPDAPPARQLPATSPSRALAVRPPAPAKVAHGALTAAVTVAQGWHSWMARMWDGLTLGVYRRQIRAAEAIGDREALADWVDRKERAVHQRHARLMDLPLMVVGVLRVTGIGCAGVLVLLVLLSVAVWATGVGSFTAVWVWVGGLIGGVLSVLAWLWPAWMVGLPIAVVFAAWREGET